MAPSDLARKARLALSTAGEERAAHMARGYLALTQGDAEAALVLLAVDRLVEQDGHAEALKSVSAGYVRRQPTVLS